MVDAVSVAPDVLARADHQLCASGSLQHLPVVHDDGLLHQLSMAGATLLYCPRRALLLDIQHDYVPLLLLIDKLNNEEAKQCFDWFILREYHNG